MPSFGEVVVQQPSVAVVNDYRQRVASVAFGNVMVAEIPTTDYELLAAHTGAQIAAAMGSDYTPPAVPNQPSGQFDMARVVSIVGQQVAAATSAV